LTSVEFKIKDFFYIIQIFIQFLIFFFSLFLRILLYFFVGFYFMHKNWALIDLIKLSFYNKVNDNLIFEIIDKYDSYEEFINASLPPKLNLIFNQGELFRSRKIKPEIEAEKQLELAQKFNYKIISFWDDEYPNYLKHIYGPPPYIFVRGQLKKSDNECIAMVGTRRCSSYGKIQTERFAEYFAQRDIVVVSGLAFGIDTFAHKATIKAGGATYAVIASGLDCLSPSTMQKNADEIVDNGGAIISTFKIGTKALPAFFLLRNRIISGLSKGVIVMESRLKGGALNTARFARDQNREVYAVPGNISNETSQGTNKLIADSLSKLALSPEYVFNDLSFQSSLNTTISDIKVIEFQSKSEELIYNTITQDPLHIDEIINLTELDTSTVMVDLLNLEFRNLIRQTAGRQYYKI